MWALKKGFVLEGAGRARIALREPAERHNVELLLAFEDQLTIRRNRSLEADLIADERLLQRKRTAPRNGQLLLGRALPSLPWCVEHHAHVARPRGIRHQLLQLLVGPVRERPGFPEVGGETYGAGHPPQRRRSSQPACHSLRSFVRPTKSRLPEIRPI